MELVKEVNGPFYSSITTIKENPSVANPIFTKFLGYIGTIFEDYSIGLLKNVYVTTHGTSKYNEFGYTIAYLDKANKQASVTTNVKEDKITIALEEIVDSGTTSVSTCIFRTQDIPTVMKYIRGNPVNANVRNYGLFSNYSSKLITDLRTVGQPAFTQQELNKTSPYYKEVIKDMARLLSRFDKYIDELRVSTSVTEGHYIFTTKDHTVDIFTSKESNELYLEVKLGSYVYPEVSLDEYNSLEIQSKVFKDFFNLITSKDYSKEWEMYNQSYKYTDIVK